MAARQKRVAADPNHVVDARGTLEEMREAQWKVVQAAEARLAQLDAALASLSLPDGLIVRSADYAGLGVVEASKRFLHSTGGGKTTAEIARGIRERGLSTKSVDFVPTVYATLYNAPQTFVRKNDRWYLKGAK